VVEPGKRSLLNCNETINKSFSVAIATFTIFDNRDMGESGCGRRCESLYASSQRTKTTKHIAIKVEQREKRFQDGVIVMTACGLSHPTRRIKIRSRGDVPGN